VLATAVVGALAGMLYYLVYSALFEAWIGSYIMSYVPDWLQLVPLAGCVLLGAVCGAKEGWNRMLNR
jgi:hypothetical protein